METRCTSLQNHATNGWPSVGRLGFQLYDMRHLLHALRVTKPFFSVRSEVDLNFYFQDRTLTIKNKDFRDGANFSSKVLVTVLLNNIIYIPSARSLYVR